MIFDHESLPEVAAGLRRVHLFDDTYQVVLPAGTASPGAAPRWTSRPGRGGVGRRPYRQRVVRHRQSPAGPPASSPALARADDYRAVQAFVAAGLGVAVIPGLAVAHALPGIVVRDLVSAPYRTVSVARLADEPILPQAQLMTDLLVETTVGRRGDARTGSQG